VVGILEDVHKAVSPDFQTAGHAIVLLRGSEPGDATDAEIEFGSSEYAKEILGALWGYPPELDIEKEAALQKALVELAEAGLAASAHDCSDGGLAVALSESSFVQGIGFKVDIKSAGLPAECLLFAEDASRVVISCDQASLSRIQQLAAKYGLAAEVLGETVSGQIEIKIDGRTVVSTGVEELRSAYEGALETALRTEVGV
jgi:phosphoribosylformylglycinamidine synthase